jgi:type IX secretion system PorP/SprF family membrane protein
MKKIILFLIALLPLSLIAQQEGMMSQIALNKLTINPAYAGYRERAIVTLAHRQQWTGFKGAPSTSLISFDTPTKSNQFAYGASFIQSKIGPVRKYEFNGYFSVRTKLSNKATIAWGLSAGAQMYQVNIVDLKAASDQTGQQDDALQANTQGYITPNFGAGCFYYSPKFYCGVSLPKLVSLTNITKSNAPSQNFKNNNLRTVYLNAGKIYKVNRNVNLTYNAFFMSSFNSPITAGTYLTCIYDKSYTFGVYYVLAQSAGALIQFQLDRNMKIGYSLDVSTNSLVRTNFGSHELNFSYALPSKVHRVLYPRLF